MDSYLIRFIPRNILTYDMCFKAVDICGFSLMYIPSYHKTLELCQHAVSTCSCILRYVPNKFKTYEMCLNAVKSKSYYGNPDCECFNMLKFIPHEFKTIELCKIAYKNSMLTLKYVPKTIKTSEFYMYMINIYGHAISCIPNKRKTPELCLAAVKETYVALKNIPENLITKEMIEIAIKDGILNYDEDDLINHIPVKYLTIQFKHTKIINTEDDCPICLCNEGSAWCKLECNHRFHYDCIKQTLKNRNTCPYCIREINITTKLNTQLFK